MSQNLPLNLIFKQIFFKKGPPSFNKGTINIRYYIYQVNLIEICQVEFHLTSWKVSNIKPILKICMKILWNLIMVHVIIQVNSFEPSDSSLTGIFSFIKKHHLQNSHYWLASITYNVRRQVGIINMGLISHVKGLTNKTPVIWPANVINQLHSIHCTGIAKCLPVGLERTYRRGKYGFCLLSTHKSYCNHYK